MLTGKWLATRAFGVIAIVILQFGSWATGPPPQRAVANTTWSDARAVMSAIKSAYEAYQLFFGHSLSLDQATNRIQDAISSAQTKIIAEIDRVAASDIKACTRSAMITLADIESLTADGLQAFAAATTDCVTSAQSYIEVLTDRAAVDRIGFALNTLGPIALIVRAYAGLHVDRLTESIVAANRTTMLRLTPSCRLVEIDEQHAPPPWPPSQSYYLEARCQAYNGDEGADPRLIYHEVDGTLSRPVNYSVARTEAAQFTSYPLSVVALLGLDRMPFGPALKQADFICVDTETCGLGDVNGDGKADAVSFVRSTRPWNPDRGDVFVALSSASGFQPATQWSDWFCVDDEECLLADVNGDGLDDAVALVKSSRGGADKGDVWVALSYGTGFGQPRKWSDWICVDAETCAVADVNGDRKADVVAFVRSTRGGVDEGDVWVALASNDSFLAATKWSDWICVEGETCATADVNGDGQADAVAFVKSSRPEPDQGDVWVALANLDGTGFLPAATWAESVCVGDETCVLADVNNDGTADLTTFVRSTRPEPDRGDVYVAMSTGAGFQALTKRHDFLCVDQEACLMADVDGDRRADAVAFVKSTRTEPGKGDVFVGQSTDNTLAPPWAAAG